MEYKAKIQRGEELFLAGKLDQAQALFEIVLSHYPENNEALNNMGVIHHTRGDLKSAETFFLKALEYNENHIDALMNLSDLYQNTERLREAVGQLEKCTKLCRRDFDLINRLSQVYLELGDAFLAREAMRKSLLINPEQDDVRESLSLIEGKKPNLHIEPNESRLNLLFVQEAPCIRNYKMASALRSKGHSVTLAYTKAKLSQMYTGLNDDVYNRCIQLKNYRNLWDISKDYDIIHCHNEPDILTVAALAGDKPVVHDTHDLISLRSDGDPHLSFFEGIANRGAAGRVYTTPHQMEEAKRLYGIGGESLVFYNYASEDDLPVKFLPKLSDFDGKVHIVYEGGIGGNGHRDFISLFVELANENICIHIYPTFHDQHMARFFSDFQNIHYYHPLCPKQIMEEMTQYDFGIIPFNIKNGNKRFLDSTLANKLFEYLASGLPVIASPLKTYIDYFAANPVGMVFESPNDILGDIQKLKTISREVDFSQKIFTYEREINKLESFYRRIIGAHDQPEQKSEILLPELSLGLDKRRDSRLQMDENFYDDLFLSGGWQQEYHKPYRECAYFESWLKVLSWIKDTPNPRIIEIGCGPGQFADMLFDSGMTNYQGIDFSKTAIAMAKRNNEAHKHVFTVENALSSNIFLTDYNTVILLEVLEHIDEDLVIIDKIRTGTTVFFSVPNFDSKGHVRFFTTKEDLMKRYADHIEIRDIEQVALGDTSNILYIVRGFKR